MAALGETRFQCLLDCSRAHGAQSHLIHRPRLVSVSFGLFGIKFMTNNPEEGRRFLVFQCLLDCSNCLTLTLKRLPGSPFSSFSVFWIVRLKTVQSRKKLLYEAGVFQCLLDCSIAASLWGAILGLIRRVVSVSFGLFTAITASL